MTEKKNKVGRPTNESLKNKGGRPSVLTKETITKLEEAFSIGASDLEACGAVGISIGALYRYQTRNPKFKKRKEKLKDMPAYAARKNVVKAIQEGKAEESKWYLERKKKAEFSSRQEHTGEGGGPITIKPIAYGDSNTPQLPAQDVSVTVTEGDGQRQEPSGNLMAPEGGQGKDVPQLPN